MKKLCVWCYDDSLATSTRKIKEIKTFLYFVDPPSTLHLCDYHAKSFDEDPLYQELLIKD